MPIEFNALETNRFDVRCARITEIYAPLAEITRYAQAEDIQFVSIRVPTNDIARVQELENDGYRLMDTLVSYTRPLRDVADLSDMPSGYHVRQATVEDAVAVGQVAKLSFAGYSGHFHADPRFDSQQADAVYVEWAEQGVAQCAADTTSIVLEHDEQIVAFLIMGLGKDAVGHISLVCVHPSHQGHGLYGHIVDHGLHLLAGMKLKEVRAQTQVTNIASQKTWSRRGFHLMASHYTLHKWFY